MTRFLYFILATLTIVCAQAETINPLANPEAIVRSGDMRFTILTPQMIRIEWSNKQIFEDNASFSVINRRLPVPHFTTREENGYLYIDTDSLHLQYKVSSFPGTFNPAGPENLNITFKMNGRKVVWYPWKKDERNLKGTCRTLDGSNGDNKRSELEDGLLSRSGWAVIDDSYATKRSDGGHTLRFEKNSDGFDWVTEPADKNAIDLYFMGYGRDYKRALKDYTKIAGSIPLPPTYAFGYWYSKYQKYSSSDFMNLITDVETNNVPIDVMVIDTDWHINGWTGWSWNKELIPDPQGLITWLHNHLVKVPLNLHPAYGVDSNEDNFLKLCKELGYDPRTTNIPWKLEDYNFYKSMFNNIIRLREKEGVDFWWLDWQQWLTNPRFDGLSETFWCNHVFFEDMRLNRTDRRPMIFHRWGGLGSHRYQIGFSGDSHSNFETLAFQPYFTATASNVGYGYWGHDLGGHVQAGDNNPELYLRWIQYGVFSPIFRTHSTNTDNIERRIWKYPNFNKMLDAVRLRYSLFPYIYTAARECYDTGISICRPLYYDFPELSDAYKYEGEYMFGNDILVAPIVTAANSATGLAEKDVWLPEGEWWSASDGKFYNTGNHSMSFTDSQIPYFIKSGSIIPNYPRVQTVQARPDTLILKVIPGVNGSSSLYEDEGDNSNYASGAYTTTRFSQETTENQRTITIEPREGAFEGMPTSRTYEIEILSEDQPSGIEINGEVCSSDEIEGASKWHYDPSSRTTFITIPNADFNQPIIIKENIGSSAVNDAVCNSANFTYNRTSGIISVNFTAEC